MFKIRVIASSLLLAGCALFNSAMAVTQGAYLGFNAGYSNTHNKSQNVQMGTTPETTAPSTPSNTGMAGGFILGYAFNPYASFEFGFIHYASSTYPKPEGSQVTNDATINTNAVDIAVKGTYPIKDFSIFGKIGLIDVSASGSGSLAPLGNTSGPNNNALRPMYALGVGYDVTQNWVVDFTYTTFSGSGDVQGADYLGLGVSYHFVDLMCGQFLC